MPDFIFVKAGCFFALKTIFFPILFSNFVTQTKLDLFRKIYSSILSLNIS